MAASERRRQLVGSGTFPRLHPAPAVGPAGGVHVWAVRICRERAPLFAPHSRFGVAVRPGHNVGAGRLDRVCATQTMGPPPGGRGGVGRAGHCGQPPGGTPAGPGHRPRAGARFVQSLHHQGPSGSARGPGCPGRVPAPGRDQRRPGDYGLVGCRRRRRAQYRRGQCRGAQCRGVQCRGAPWPGPFPS